MPAWSSEDVYRQIEELQIVDKLALAKAWDFAVGRKMPFEDVVIDRGLISEANMGRVLADLAKSKFVHLAVTPITLMVMKSLPFEFSQANMVLAFRVDEAGAHVAMADPHNLRVINLVSKRLKKPVIPYLATKRDIQDALALYNENIQEVFEKIIKTHAAEAEKTAQKLPVVKIVDMVIANAYQNKASDIHIEPQDKLSLIRFRIDGQLQDVVTLPKNIHEQLVSRIKILASLRTDEQKAAQDGKIVFRPVNGEENMDIRVSIVPVLDGEKVVLRLLSEKSRQLTLPELGISDKDIAKIQKAYALPHGMILSTGPTGCGKTTTMYGILKILNTREVNIATIEDPVEYEIEGVNQIQVNTQTDLTFAKGLRSIVRQDPNIILVGEIRDPETADIGVNAAMTGHLVLSTLHTNDAATCFPRLLEMEIEPFLVASTVSVVIGQRLVRRICLSCRESVNMDIDYIRQHFSPDLVERYFMRTERQRFYKGRGCPVCRQTGYHGRVGIFEVLEVDDEIRKAIQEKKSASEIADVAIANGMVTMLDDGIMKVRQGVTTIEEVIRVAKEE